MTRWLLWAGVIGPVLFVAAFALIGLLRPDYDPMRHYVSLLALTDAGWQQIANFLVFGVLLIAGGLGMWRAFEPGPGSRAIPILVMFAGVGAFLAGIFVTDPCCGYPPGTPEGPNAEVTVSGGIHDVASLAVFLALPAANVILARRLRGAGGTWGFYSYLTAVATLGFLFSAFAFRDISGLLQRLAIVFAFAWVARLSLALLRREDAEGGEATGA